MHICFTVTEDDYINFNLHFHIIENKKTITSFIKIILLCSIFLFLSLVAITSNYIYSFLISILFVFILNYKKQYFLENSIKKTIKQNLSNGNFIENLGDINLSINNSEIIYINSTTNVTSIHKNILKTVEYKDLLLIYLSNTTSIIIPLKYFKDDEHKNNFIKTIECFK